MRVTVWALLAFAALSFAVAAMIAGQRSPARAGVTVPGLVTELADGPHHALVKVTPQRGAPFVFPANTEGGLTVGQHVTVRYDAEQPLATAEVVTGDRANGTRTRTGTVWSLVIAGLAFLAAAAFSPLLVRWFPGLIGFRIRP